MNSLKRMTLASLAIGIFAHTAAAADFMEPVVDWGGFYGGLHAGWGWSDLDYSIQEDSDFWNSPEFEGFSVDADGPVAGAQA